jgi:hypothetical protein
MRVDAFPQPPRATPRWRSSHAWWEPVAARHAARYDASAAFPVMWAAAHVVRWLDDATTLALHRPGVLEMAEYHAELISAVVVAGYLDHHPDAAILANRELAQLAFGWSHGAEADWPWYADVSARAATDARPLRPGWAPWWRAAFLWPVATDVDLFATVCEYLWQRRGELVVIDARRRERPPTPGLFDEWGWAPRAGIRLWAPQLRLVDVLQLVVGPVRSSWPWPYNTWPLGTATARR